MESSWIIYLSNSWALSFISKTIFTLRYYHHIKIEGMIFMKKTIVSPGAITKLEGDISGLSEQVVKCTTTTVSTLDALKSFLNTQAASISDEEIKIVGWYNEFTDSNFTRATFYRGILQKVGTSSYYTVNASSLYGDNILIGYRNGSWTFNSVTEQIGNISNLSAPIKTDLVSGINSKVYSDMLAGNASFSFTFKGTSCVIVIGRNSYGCAAFYLEQWGGKFKIYSSDNAGDIYENNITINATTVTITNPHSSYIPYIIIC